MAEWLRGCFIGYARLRVMNVKDKVQSFHLKVGNITPIKCEVLT